MIITTKLYTHSNDEWGLERFKALCEKHGAVFSEEAAKAFSYAGYEIEFGVEVDTDTGEVMATYVNGAKLLTPVQI